MLAYELAHAWTTAMNSSDHIVEVSRVGSKSAAQARSARPQLDGKSGLLY